ncbi:hypothetical protein [Mucilaginibacter sp. L3T2-6]|uniref:hypothetical protein n=1 Tax=Mucilaginibacter sp. L3T2-6 TaxID=3062491 RepID=UPI002674C738|nr:hypothetical protein [Mucilaginibacter sp. L3T2-6]MDO3643733.1 hypothetical protein [Mucilaginibacter sp. L3T2-6]MDV6216184.1 hypothetical protein [Mucilaginibacter sp. L3T2-6]
MIQAANQKETADYSKWIRRMATDGRMLATHVSLFTALFICWHRSEFNSPFAVNRRELMNLSKIASIATYHKCIKELDRFGYIRYQPSYHPKNGSLIYWPEVTAGL